MDPIRKVAVIGSGVMGAAIAAQVANGGVPVLLLDVPAKEGDDRSAVAAAALARLRKSEPAPFMGEEAASLVSVGNIEDDLDQLAGCDWIVEAIVEKLEIKQSLYARIDAVRRPGTPVSSNTSTIPLARLIQGLGDAFARDFLITHFFNPPRYLRLLEIVTGDKTDLALAERVMRFGDVVLGKSIVRCKDTPGFIANRLGAYWLQLAVMEAIDGGVGVEEADAVMGRPLGIPKTGVFGLLDLIGLDLMPHIADSLAATLRADDAFHATLRDEPLLNRMIAEGRIGRKGKGGFYRLNRAEGRKTMEAVDLATGKYRASTPGFPDLKGAEKDIRALLAADTKAGRYAWRVLGPVLAYAASLVPEAADDVVAIDDAMKLGYAWRWGPFELIDKIGAGWLAERLAAEGRAVPPLLASADPYYRVEAGRRQYRGLDGYHHLARPEGVLSLDDVRLVGEPVLKSASAALWDLGEGVACYELIGKGNAIDQAALTTLEETIAVVGHRFKALVLYTEGANFSFGANLGAALFAANLAAWDEIDALIASGQRIYKALKYAPFPVVAAPAGMALGGGCEILLHSDAIQAHAELYAGLVECGVGLIPGWGGCKEMLLRWSAAPSPQGPMPAPMRVFEMVSQATRSKSAADARRLKILRAGDAITMNRDRLLADAKAKALALAVDYVPTEPAAPLALPGPAGKLAMDRAVEDHRQRGLATPHDVTVAGVLAEVLSGGDADPVDPVGEDAILTLERTRFMRLIKMPETQARIEHTLDTGKPLRN